MKKEYCTQNNGNCQTCSLVNYGLDCANNPIAPPKKPNGPGNKWSRVMANYNGHKGWATIEHVEHNIASAYPTAYAELTGVQYGKLMSVANTSYQDGKASNKIEMWAYDSDLDWLAGMRGTDTVIEVKNDTIIITSNARTPEEKKKIYKLQKEA